MLERNKAIALYDSGRGVESVLRACQALLPYEKWLVLQDNDRPYGSKSNQEIIDRGFSCFSEMMKRDVKAIVVACHTSSAIALPQLRRHFSVPMVGMLRPTARLLADSHTHDDLIWLATPASVRADKLEPLARQLGYQGTLYPVACDQWVDCLENGHLDALELLLKRFIIKHQQLLDAGNVKLLYGCTHYPLLDGMLRRLIVSHFDSIDPAFAVAQALKFQLEHGGLLRVDRSPSVNFLNGMVFKKLVV